MAESQTAIVDSPPGLPGSYELDCDITFAISYAVFPKGTHEIAGDGKTMLEAFEEETKKTGILTANERHIDYMISTTSKAMSVPVVGWGSRALMGVSSGDVLIYFRSFRHSYINVRIGLR